MELAERARVRVRPLMRIMEDEDTRRLLDGSNCDCRVKDLASQATEERIMAGGMNDAQIL